MDEQNINIEQTSYETDPVESLNDALYAFVEAYDMLQLAISEYERIVSESLADSEEINSDNNGTGGSENSLTSESDSHEDNSSSDGGGDETRPNGDSHEVGSDGEDGENEDAHVRDFTPFRSLLKLSMYRPIRPLGENRPPISLYELGVVYFPSTGKYAVHRHKLEKALQQREDDIRAMFVQEDALLPRLCEILKDFLETEPPCEIHVTATRFLNECRRLTAMWV